MTPLPDACPDAPGVLLILNDVLKGIELEPGSVTSTPLFRGAEFD